MVYSLLKNGRTGSSVKHEGVSSSRARQQKQSGKIDELSIRYRCVQIVCVCVYLCVCFSSRLMWTSSSLDVPAGVTQEEGHTGFLIHLPSAVHALIFLARRIQPFLSLVDREVEFCVLTI